MNDLLEFYENLPEPNKGCFLALRKIIMDYSSEFTEEWKYKLPFFYYRGKPFCYLWKDKVTTFPYVTFVRSMHINRPELELGSRKKMKAITVNPNKDIDVNLLHNIMEESLQKF